MEKDKIVMNDAGCSKVINRPIIKSDEIFLTIAIAIDKDVIHKKEHCMMREILEDG